MKDQNTVIEEFNGLVNMTVSELETWLKSDDSQSAGWPKGEDGAESVGHDSGRNIVSILKSNPDKDPEKYTDDQVDHMRKVVSYCKRHLAQEGKANSEKSTEEVKKTKSYASLKNWGHDILKSTEGGENKEGNKGSKKVDSDQNTGEKRKADDKNAGANKKRDTKADKSSDDDAADEKKGHGGKANGTKGAPKTRSKSNGATANNRDNDVDGKDADEGKGDEDDGDADDGKENEGEEQGGQVGGETTGEKPAKGPQPGDTVSWNWGNGQPEGKVLDVKAEKTTVETKRGNEVSRKGDAEDPAVVLDTGKSKAIKSAHELN